MPLLYEIAANKLLRDVLTGMSIPQRLPTEEQLALRYGVSRPTIRKVLQHLETRGVARIKGHSRFIIRAPREDDFFPVDENEPSPRERVEASLIDWLCRGRDNGKMYLAETELAEELGCNRNIIREELARISCYGLVIKQPHRGWKIVDFTPEMLMQIWEVRELFERYAISKVLALPADAPVWKELDYLQAKLQGLSRNDVVSLQKAVQIDKLFHDTLLRVCSNRYMSLFHNMCHLLIEYNLRREEVSRERILQGLDDHLAIIDSLLRRDERTALDRLHLHFSSARHQTMQDASVATPV
jgi:DNA-binding GntR family transcriptional regulator